VPQPAAARPAGDAGRLPAGPGRALAAAGAGRPRARAQPPGTPARPLGAACARNRKRCWLLVEDLECSINRGRWAARRQAPGRAHLRARRQVTSTRRGLRNQLKTLLWRKAAPGPGAPPARESPRPGYAGGGGVPGTPPGGLGALGAAPAAPGAYSAASVEGQMRALADLAFLMQARSRVPGGALSARLGTRRHKASHRFAATRTTPQRPAGGSGRPVQVRVASPQQPEQDPGSHGCQAWRSVWAGSERRPVAREHMHTVCAVLCVCWKGSAPASLSFQGGKAFGRRGPL